MPEILRCRKVANPDLGHPVRLKLSRLMALLVTSGTICWTGASWSQIPVVQPVAAASLLPTELSLHQFVRQVLQVNKAVRSKRNEQELADTAVSRAGAIFQPQIELAAVNARSRVQNTPEEELLRQGLGFYDRKGLFGRPKQLAPVRGQG